MTRVQVYMGRGKGLKILPEDYPRYSLTLGILSTPLPSSPDPEGGCSDYQSLATFVTDGHIHFLTLVSHSTIVLLRFKLLIIQPIIF